MAEKKITKKNNTTKQINVEPQQETVELTNNNEGINQPETQEEILKGSILEEVQKGVEEKINTIANELNNKMKQVKQQEEDFMKKIDNNPNDVAQLAQEELNKVEQQIKNVQQEIKSKTSNNISFTNTWNGWGFSM